MPDRSFPFDFCARYLTSTILDRARLLLRCKQRYEQLNPAARHGGDRQSVSYRQKSKVKNPHSDFQSLPTKGENPSLCSADSPPLAFSTAAAARLGCTPRNIQQTVRIAQLIPPHLQAVVAGTPIADRKGELTQIARMDTAEQERILAWLKTTPASDRPAARNESS